MPNRPDIDEQLQDLQERYAFQEDLINSLNQALIDQGRQIERVELMVKELKNSMQEISSDLEQFSPGEERPPHY